MVKRAIRWWSFVIENLYNVTHKLSKIAYVYIMCLYRYKRNIRTDLEINYLTAVVYSEMSLGVEDVRRDWT